VPIDSSWKLTFDDEFNGSTLDTSKWTPNWMGSATAITKPINPVEIAAYDPAQVTVSGGVLHLTANPTPVTVGGTQFAARTGAVETAGKFEQTTGYFEARVYLPSVNGLIANWPGIWTDGHNWPATGEMDIMEGLSGHASYHYHSSSTAAGATPAGTYTGWHVFAGLWEAGKVTFYYDNQQVGQITSGVANSPQFLVLNNSLSQPNYWGGPQLLNADMQVDWVHVYSHDPNAHAVASQANYTGPGGTGGVATSPPPPPPPSSDTVNGTSGNDHLAGSAGNDAIHGLGGNDSIEGGAGNDTIWGGAGNDTIDGGSGSNTLVGDQDGGTGNDTFIVNGTGNTVIESANEGNDTIIATVTYTRPANVENITLSGGAAINATGNGLDNHLNGNYADNVLCGLGGNDTIDAGNGNDTLIGGAGQDVIYGDGGSDTYAYAATSDSSPGARDDVSTYDHGDRFDFAAIDANGNASGNQAFSFAGSAFTRVAGQVIAQSIATNEWTVSADVNGDGVADMAIHVHTLGGFGSWQSSDFVL
jgi:Ca2+-binding RTX toxin-like protein